MEDNSELRRYLVEILNAEYKIIEAVDGEEGINEAYKFIPDLIVSDVMMPKIDGYELCSVLKNDTRTSHVSLIILTAKAERKDKIEGLTTVPMIIFQNLLILSC